MGLEQLSALYRIAVIPFFVMPDAASLQSTYSRELLADLERLSLEDLSEALQQGCAQMQAYANGTLECPDDGLTERAQILSRDRTQLLRALGPSLGAPPPYESHYSAAPASETLARIAEAYRASGVSLSFKELPDYLGVELEFMRTLLNQEIFGDEAAYDAALAAERAFFHEHLASWVDLWLEAASPHAQTVFFQGHMEVLRGLIAHEQARLGICG